MIDRRATPSHGYRAVHLVVRFERGSIEIQVRTAFQHRWADLSEKLADEYHDQTIKYGGAPEEVRSLLMRLSTSVAEFEEQQRRVVQESARMANLLEGARTVDASTQKILDAFSESVAEGARKSELLRNEFEALRNLLRIRNEPLH